MRRYQVYKRDERGVIRNVGSVAADNQLQADMRARNLYGRLSWTTAEQLETA